MEKSESRRCLLSDDYNDIWRAETEGFSSGYDSAIEKSESDTVNDSNNRSEVMIDNEAETKQSEVMNFQNTDALCEQLKYIVAMPELCDVTFLVGPNKVPVYGVKAILGSRSRVFYQLILDRQRELEHRATSTPKLKYRKSSKLLVDVKKYDSDDFRKIVQFVHCGTVDVTLTNVTGLLCGAYQFGLDDLKIVCWDFIQRCLKCDVSNYSAISLLDCARKYSRHKAGNKLMSKLCDFLKKRSTCSVATPVLKSKDAKQRTSCDLRPRPGSITTTV